MARKRFLEGTQTKEDLYRNNILITSLPPLVKNGVVDQVSFVTLFLRVIYLAERQKKQNLVGFMAVAGILFTHFCKYR
jgi:transcriptional regulator with AAA-type ATPase domain